MPGLRRGMPMPSMEANEAVFAAPEPAEGKVSAGRVVQDDGSILVFAVRKVTPGDGSEASEQERTMLRQQLARMAGDEDAMALLRALRQRMRVTTIEARL